MNTEEQQESVGLVARMADEYGMDRKQFWGTLMQTVIPGQKASNEQVLAVLAVAQQHGLNPFTKEIYAFPARGGGIQPIVSIDGWLKLMNNHPQADGIEVIENDDDEGNLVSVTVRVYRKDRSQPTTVTESYEECKRNTDPWKQKPRRMLRHKATIQAIRYAFSYSGIIDEDEMGMYRDMDVLEPDGKSAKAKRLEGLMGNETETVIDVEHEDVPSMEEDED